MKNKINIKKPVIKEFNFKSEVDKKYIVKRKHPVVITGTKS